MKVKYKNWSINKKLLSISLSAFLPMVILAAYLIVSLNNAASAYSNCRPAVCGPCGYNWKSQRTKKEVPKDEEMRSYMKNLMGIMEQSIQQFRESNDRFTSLVLSGKGACC